MTQPADISAKTIILTLLVPLICAPGALALAPQALVGRLAKGRTAEREAAFVALEEMPGTALAPQASQLATMLETGDWPAQCYAARLLELTGSRAKPVAPRVQSAAVKALAAGRQTSVIMLARALAGIGPGSAPTLVAALTRELGSGDPGKQLLSLKAFGALGRDGKASIPAITPMLKSADSEIRAQAARVLSLHGPASAGAVPLLAANLTHKEPFVVRESARALAAVGPGAKSAVPALRVAVKRRESGVPEDAVAALGAIGPGAVAAYDELAALLISDDPRAVRADRRGKQISNQAEVAISRMGAAAVKPLVNMIPDRDKGPIAAKILGRMGPTAKSAVPLLIETLDRVSRDRRKTKMTSNVAAALVKIDPNSADKAIPVFAKVLMSEDLVAATYAANFLTTYGKASKDPRLKKMAISVLVKCLETGGKKKKKSEEFGRLCTQICKRLPEFGKEADVAVPALREAVFSGASFATIAKITWQKIRPNEKVSKTPSLDGVEKQEEEEEDDDLLGL